MRIEGGGSQLRESPPPPPPVEAGTQYSCRYSGNSSGTNPADDCTAYRHTVYGQQVLRRDAGERCSAGRPPVSGPLAGNPAVH